MLSTTPFPIYKSNLNMKPNPYLHQLIILLVFKLMMMLMEEHQLLLLMV